MAQQTINIGASPNDGTGTPLRTSFDYTNQNFTELYTALGGGVGLPGATTQVIFNDGGTNLAGDAGLVYNKTTDTLTAGNATITGAATVGTTLGVTGVSTFAAGTALLPALTTTGDTNTGIYYPAADTFAVTTGGTERYRVDSAGNVGIGGTPSAWASTYRALQIGLGSSIVGVTNDVDLNLTNNARFDGTNWKYLASSPAERYRISAGAHFWYIVASGAGGDTITTWNQAMTLDASGRLLVGTTSVTTTAPLAKLHISLNGTDRWAVGPQVSSADFIIQAVTGFGVYLAGTAATSWSSASDERAKDIIEPISNAVEKVGSLRAVIGKFKADKTNTRKSFLMAQDVLAVLPEAVDTSNPDRLGLAYSDVIPLLVAAIKELTARVQTLEAR